jgi:hypothetical protein
VRTHSAQDDKVFASAGQASYVRVLVQDAGATWRDLTALYGSNYVDDLDFEENVDSGIQTVSFTVGREVFKNSLAPFVAASRLNQLGGGSKLLKLGAAVRVEVQIQGSGVPADATKWQVLFLGRIVHRDDASGEKIKVECHDQVSYLQQTFLEKDRPYGVWQPGRRYIAGTVLVPVAYAQTPADPAAQYMKVGSTGTTNGDYWKASTVYPTGSVVQPNTSPLGTFYKNNGSSGTSAGSEPSWPGSNTGGTVVDGGVTWTEIGTSEAAFEPAWPAKGSGLTVSEAGTGTITYTEQTLAGTPLETQIQQLLDDNYGVSAVTLYTPVASGYYVRAYGQKRANTWDAVKALADGCIGWDLRYFWDNGTSQYRLTLQPPGGSTSARTTPTSSYTFGLGKYRDISSFAQDLAAIRNKVSIKYGNRGNLDTALQPTATEYVASDATSIALYGKAFCEIGEEGTGYISTTAEATTLGNNVLADLKDPLVDAAITTEFCWWMQLNDGLTLSADNQHFDADQLLCIYSIKHSFTGNGVAKSSFQLRGKPCSRWVQWHNFGTGSRQLPTNHLTPFRPPPAPVVTPTIGGGSITIKPPALDRFLDYQGTEIHVSTVNGFTPSSSTLQGTIKGGRLDLGAGVLTAGTTYYARCCHRDGRGTPPIYSAQTSFVAGYVALSQLSAAVTASLLGPTTQSGGRMERWTDSQSGADSSAFPFDKGIFAAGMVTNGTNGTITVTNGGRIKVSAGMTIRTGTAATIVTIDNSCRAQLVLKQNSVAVWWGKWCRAEDGIDGIAEITAMLDTEILAGVGDLLSLSLVVVNGVGTTFTIGTTYKVTLKGRNAGGNSSPGCWFSALCLPQ